MRRAMIVVVIALWSAAAAWGLGRLAAYAQSPGGVAAPPAGWPEGCGVELDRSRPTVVVFFHPRCPCSTATAAELERALAGVSRPVRLIAVFCRPAGLGPEWGDTPLRARVGRVPGVEVFDDADGRLRRAFGARTSGQVCVYDAAGVRRFSGGITPSRGHEGDNAGRAALVGLVNGGVGGPTGTPVFGCSLGGEEPCGAEGDTCTNH